MANKIPAQPINWHDFETLMHRVSQAAIEPGNEKLYRFLIFCGLVAYGGLPPRFVLAMQWDFLSVPRLFSEPEEVAPYLRFPRTSPLTINAQGGVDCWEVNISEELLDIIEISYKLSLKMFSDNKSTFRYRKIITSVKSKGKNSMRAQSLNILLKDVANEFGGSDNISALTLYKTYFRHQFELQGQSIDALKKISAYLKHGSLDITRKFICI
ncbi:MAG: hypothetical protein EOO61_01800 [Hymenobacter sp.]|nr:MAG: hypothetical protein EOO61_01800 [Hymenobacter sp.]